MPRRTTKQFQQDHDFLREVWLKDYGWYAELTAKEQWQLHAYFAPSLDVGPDALAQHRRQMATKHHALPQQAGWALAKLCRALEYWAQFQRAPIASTPGKRRPRGRTTVATVVRPQPDASRLARVIITDLLNDIITEQSDAASNRSGPG